jgi:hypothetical protein
MDRPESPFQPAWVFGLILVFWVLVLVYHGSLGYIVGSGGIGLGAWLLLYLSDRDDRNADRQIRLLKAERDRSNARVAELETELRLPRTA